MEEAKFIFGMILLSIGITVSFIGAWNKSAICSFVGGFLSGLGYGFII